MIEGIQLQIDGFRGFILVLTLLSISYHSCVKHIFQVVVGSKESEVSPFHLMSIIVHSRPLYYIMYYLLQGFNDYFMYSKKIQNYFLDGFIIILRQFFKYQIPVWFCLVIVLSLPNFVHKVIGVEFFIMILLGIVCVRQFDMVFTQPFSHNSLSFTNCCVALIVVQTYIYFGRSINLAMKSLVNVLFVIMIIAELYSNQISEVENRHYIWYLASYAQGIRVANILYPYSVDQKLVNNTHERAEHSGALGFIQKQMDSNKFFGDVIVSFSSTFIIIILFSITPLDNKQIDVRMNQSLLIIAMWFLKCLFILVVSTSFGLIFMNRTVVIKKICTFDLLVSIGRNQNFYHPVCLIVFYVILSSINNIEIGPFSLFPVLCIMVFAVTMTIICGDLTSLLLQPIISRIDSSIEAKYDQYKQKKMADSIRNTLQKRGAHF